MKKRRIAQIGSLTVLMTVLMAWGIGQKTYAQTMTMAPHMIVLNGPGVDVKTVWGGTLLSGSTFVANNINLYFAGTLVATSYLLEYCWIDSNFKAYFDRQAIIDDPFVKSLAGQGPVEATINGTYTVIDQQGILHEFVVDTKWDWVTVVGPGKNKSR